MEMDLWAQDDVDLVAPGFIAVRGGLDRRDAPRDGHRGTFFHLGDDSGFRPERAGEGP